jgi:hypothetical protein
MDPWVAIMIDGEPVRDYVRRVFSTNDDAEITRLANLARKHKERIGNEIRWTLGDTTKARRSRHPAEFLDQQAAGSGRKEKKLRSVMTATQDRNADRREEDRKQKGSRPKWAKRPQGDCKGIEESKQ